MITVSTKINRPFIKIWDFFIKSSNWIKWYGTGVKGTAGGGTLIVWDSGASDPISVDVSRKEFRISGHWMDETFRFKPDGKNTVVEIVQSDPKGGARLTDGGKSNKAELERMLRAFKTCTEKEIK